MSTKGIYSALSGALAQSTKMDTIANNIANVNTAGFKRDQKAFYEYLTDNEKAPEVLGIPRDVASIESFYNQHGREGSFVDVKGTFTDFSQGSLKPTGNKLDVALDGPGFFEIQTNSGVKYSRAGNFSLDGEGRLVTRDGNFVLKEGDAGTPPEERQIKFSGQGEVSITDQGDVFEGETLLGKISVVKTVDKAALKKIGFNLYEIPEGSAVAIEKQTAPSMRQGFVETSNVNIVQEMVDMIQTQRVFEGTQKAISAYDSMSDKVVNVVGKINP